MPQDTVKPYPIFYRFTSFPKNSTLIQYVDDLLLTSPPREDSEIDAIYLLQQLVCKGHKASKGKLQFSKEKIHRIGHDLTAEGISLSPESINTIQNFPRHTSKLQYRSLLGLAEYCRSWVPYFSLIATPL